jgi:CheY-like chemotaxis protein
MSRILLADHSPHAQRMGERILRDEGFEVATVTDGETALLRLKDLAPDLILADISLPSRSGYDICEYVKTSGKYPQTRVVLTAGPVTPYDEARAQAAGADGLVRKPFEATLLLNAVQPLLEDSGKPAQPKPAVAVPAAAASGAAITVTPPAAALPQTPVARPIDREQVRAAVILALEASMINIIENVTDKVIVALEADTRPAAPQAKAAAVGQAAKAPAFKPAEPTEARTGASYPASPVTGGKPAPTAATPGTQAGPQPDEPVVRIRTPLFRTL